MRLLHSRDYVARVLELTGVELQWPKPGCVHGRRGKPVDLEGLLDAAGLEVVRSKEAVGQVCSLSMLVVEARMEHQDDQPTSSACNAAELLDGHGRVV